MMNTTSMEYTVARSISPNRLTLNGVIVGQERINNLIGMSKDTFMHTVLFGQDKPLFFDLKPRGEDGTVQRGAPAQRWDERSAEAAIRCTDLDQKQTALTPNCPFWNSRKKKPSQHLEAVQEHSDAWTKENSKSFDALTTKIAEEEQILAALMNEMATADLGYDGAVTEYKALEKEFRRISTRD